MPRKREDLTGRRFGRLLVLRPGTPGPGAMWMCACDCGAVVERVAGAMRSGNTSSCGCLGREHNAGIGQRATTHGHSVGRRASRDLLTWRHMKQRCSDPRDKSFKNYGARGISVCSRWLASFEDFLADIGPRPSPKHTLDRINNDGNYEPDNCRWATRLEQNRNMRKMRGLSRDAALPEGVTRATVYERLRAGWTMEDATTKPRTSRAEAGRRGTIARVALYGH